MNLEPGFCCALGLIPFVWWNFNSRRCQLAEPAQDNMTKDGLADRGAGIQDKPIFGSLFHTALISFNENVGFGRKCECQEQNAPDPKLKKHSPALYPSAVRVAPLKRK
jgi:hypothetical protein